MRRARFKHYAHIVCDKFCGWGKCPDDGLFAARLGGVIGADALRQTATLDGKPHDFSALGGIHDWLLKDLKDNHLSPDSLSDVRIELSFLCNCLPDSAAPGYELHFWGHGIVVSGEDRYEAPYKKSERYISAL